MSLEPAPHSLNATLYVGTHRRAHKSDAQDAAHGIYAFRVDREFPFEACGLTRSPQPGWLVAHPHRPVLYAVNEVRSMDGRDGGAVSAFAIDRKSGALRFLNSRPLPPMPCHCAVDSTGRYLLVATFGGGSVHLFPVEQDGTLGEECDHIVHTGSSTHPQRQTMPHAHAAVLSPDNCFVVVPDLGIDRLLVHALDTATGKLVPCPDRTIVLPPLSGPRHAVFSPDSRYLYLVNEMSATVMVFAWTAPTGALLLLQTVDLLPKDFIGLRSGAAIAIHPFGNIVYVTTRSHGSSGMPPLPGLDLLVWFSVDRASGLLTLGERLPSGGGIPRSLALSPDAGHLYVGHQCSGWVTEFSLDNGVPVATGRMVSTPVPVCLVFVF